ncbi:hypothetical protein HZH68_012169 [Vespula germanica]|uniref:Uncharacterized protein n=1 Tax=Vespula germanica TaxID=30212 RepID=A0A834JNE0_VESGE|nr:hypothetical protein HZH68_012169 [Vespula germanica]
MTFVERRKLIYVLECDNSDNYEIIEARACPNDAAYRCRFELFERPHLELSSFEDSYKFMSPNEKKSRIFEKGVSPSSALNRGKERCCAKTGSMQISKSLLAKLTAGGPKINRKANSRVAARCPKRPQVRYKMSIVSVINHVATGKETTSLMGYRKNEDRGKSSTINFTFSLTPRYCVKFKKVPDNGSLSVSETFDKSCGTSQNWTYGYWPLETFYYNTLS